MQKSPEVIINSNPPAANAAFCCCKIEKQKSGISPRLAGTGFISAGARRGVSCYGCWGCEVSGQLGGQFMKINPPSFGGRLICRRKKVFSQKCEIFCFPRLLSVIESRECGSLGCGFPSVFTVPRPDESWVGEFVHSNHRLLPGLAGYFLHVHKTWCHNPHRILLPPSAFYIPVPSLPKSRGLPPLVRQSQQLIVKPPKKNLPHGTRLLSVHHRVEHCKGGKLRQRAAKRKSFRDWLCQNGSDRLCVVKRTLVSPQPVVALEWGKHYYL